MNPEQMAGGGMPQSPQAGTQVAPGQATVGADMKKVTEALGMAVQQCVDQQGFVDMNKLVALWPQIAQQTGLNVPFQAVMQLIQQNPQLLEDLVVRYGLAGMVHNGQRITAEQMVGMQSGASGGGVG
jgi:hypothetical protein